jgi:hypothetical protein
MEHTSFLSMLMILINWAKTQIPKSTGNTSILDANKEINLELNAEETN